jgi:hypothetical protein
MLNLVAHYVLVTVAALFGAGCILAAWFVIVLRRHLRAVANQPDSVSPCSR